MTKAIDFNSLRSHADEFLQSLEKFKALLTEEEKLLKSNNIEDLTSLLEKKSHLSNKVDKTFKLFNLSHNQKNITLDQLIESKVFSTFSTHLQKQIKKIITIINQCYDLNLSNAMTVQILNNLNEVSLNLLKGQTNNTISSYGSTGEKDTSKTKTSLGKA